MQNNLLSSVYAKSLIDISMEQNQLEVVHKDILYLIEVCAKSSEFRSLMASPIVAADKKIKIVNLTVGKSISNLTDKFIQLLIRKGREKNIQQILRAFIERYNEVKGIHEVTLTTAQPLTAATKQLFLEKIKKETGFAQIDLHTKVDAEIVGGFVLEYADNLLDASIQRDLKDITKQFRSNLFEHNIR